MSQYNQHRIVKRLHPKPGTFLEIGAYDGVTYSNTFALENEGWKGICIEPNKRAYKKCCAVRKSVIHGAVMDASGSISGTIMFQESKACDLYGFIPGLAGKHETLTREMGEVGDLYRVLCYSLNTLFYRHIPASQVDYISMDTEGTEMIILRAFNFAFPVEIWTIENNYHGKELRRLMRSKGYYLLTYAGVDEVYIRRWQWTPWHVYYYLQGRVKGAIKEITRVKKSIFPKAWL